MEFSTCKKCGFYEQDDSEVFQCDCEGENRGRHWIDRVIDEIEKDMEDE